MPQKLGNGGNGLENYDAETGQYLKQEKGSASNINKKSSLFDLDEINKTDDLENNKNTGSSSYKGSLFDIKEIEDDTDLSDDLSNDLGFSSFFNNIIESNVDLSQATTEDIEDFGYDQLLAIISKEENIDFDKIKNLSEGELRRLLIAIQHSDNDFIKDKLDKLKEKYLTLYPNSWDNLWINPVNVTDWEDKAEKYESKKEYFEKYYKNLNNDKEVMLSNLESFKAAGSQYLEEKNKIEALQKQAKELLSKYYDENATYSQGRKNKAVWTKSYFESKKIFGNIAEKQKEDIEKKIGKEYYKALEDYTYSYTSINKPLRDKQYDVVDGDTLEKAKNFIDNVEKMTSALDHCSYDFDCWIQRGVEDIDITSLGKSITKYTSITELKSLVGVTFKDQGFLSCGSAKGTGFNSRPIMLNIYCPKGAKMHYIANHSHYGSENETIIQRGYDYKITKVEKKNGKVFLDLDLILDSDKTKYDFNQLQEQKKKNFNYIYQKGGII